MPEAHKAPIGAPKLSFIVMRRRDIVRASPLSRSVCARWMEIWQTTA